MSCFSDALYYYGNDTDDVVKMISRANIHGFIYPPKDNWILFVTESEMPLTLNPIIVQHNTGLLIYLVFAEDHGWEYTVFDKNSYISKYSCRWDFDVKYKLIKSFSWLFEKLELI